MKAKPHETLATAADPVHAGSARPAAAGPWVLAGAYVSLHDLLRLRVHPPGTVATGTGPERGERASRVRGRGMDFDEVRLYQPGDDVRSIDWRVTARKGKPHTKVFRQERERPTLILVDQTQSMFFGSRGRLKSVVAAEIAGRTAWRALAAQDRVGGLVLDGRGAHVFKPLRREAAVLRLLDAVVRANNALTRPAPAAPGQRAQDRARAGPRSQDQALQLHDEALQLHDEAPRPHDEAPQPQDEAPQPQDEAPQPQDEWWRFIPPLLHLARVNHRIVLVSDFLDEAPPHTGDGAAALDALAGVARHNDVEIHFVHDPLERELPPADRYRVTDGIRRQAFHSGNARLRAAYRARFAARRTAVEQAASRAGIRFTAVSTSGM